jgi:hypothetical protein
MIFGIIIVSLFSFLFSCGVISSNLATNKIIAILFAFSLTILLAYKELSKFSLYSLVFWYPTQQSAFFQSLYLLFVGLLLSAIFCIFFRNNRKFCQKIIDKALSQQNT